MSARDGMPVIERFAVGDRVTVESRTELLGLAAPGGPGTVARSRWQRGDFEVRLDSGQRRGPFAQHTSVVHLLKDADA